MSSLKHMYQRVTLRFKLTLLVVAALLLGAVTYLLLPKPDLRHYQTYSTAIFDRHGELLKISLADDDRYRLYTPIRNIAAHFQQATVMYEDQHYYSHSGVDYIALMRAFWQTYVLQERRIGASTIVMQVARLRWNIPSNTLSGKAEQIFRALQLSRHYSKQDLLEAYLNLAPYGGNIEGIGAASLIYFDKPASALSLAEALTLAVVPQNPSQRNPSRSKGMQTLQPAKLRLFERWLETHPQDQQLATLINLPLFVRQTKDLPRHAPHFVQFLLSRKKPKRSVGEIALASSVQGTIDLALQQRLEKVLEGYIAQNKARGFRNASALLLNRKSMQIEAMLGSAGFNNLAIQGQVNGTLAKRSPGSTLKPFVYALAIDAGLIHPMSMLKDLPKKYAGFAPENFGKGFVGPISAQDALIKSRNVPAVDLQSRLLTLQAENNLQNSGSNIQTFYEFLQNAGVSGLKPAQHYGLALALGGGEVSMLELVQMYAMIANSGVHKQAVSTYWVSGDNNALRESGQRNGQRSGQKNGQNNPANNTRLLSPEAALLTYDMLTKNPRPDALNYASLDPVASHTRTTAWKTGTSWAFRDAWAVAISGDYVLATWIGNFNGEGNNAFIGRTAAGPLLFRLLDTVNSTTEANQAVYDPVDIAQRNSLNIKSVTLCKTTGDLFEAQCPEKVKSLFIPGVSPIKSSNIYRRVWIDDISGLRRCDNAHENSSQKVFAFWPSDFTSLFDQAGIYIESPPAFMPECSLDSKVTQGVSPEITSPQSEVSYVIETSHKDTASIALQASADGEVSYLYWFANGEFLGTVNLSSSAPETPLMWQAKAGRYEVQVSDDFGRSAAVTVDVIAMK